MDTHGIDRDDMAALRAGEEAALSRLMQRHAQPLHHYLIRILRNEAEAEDLTQETFVRVYHHRDRFDPASKFLTWLYTIATNLARDRIRWHQRHPEASIEAREGDPEETSLKATLAAETPGPDHLLASKEQATAVRDAVARLPEDLRVPLVLAEYEERSHQEISEILHCSPKAVEMRIYHARQRLREWLMPTRRD